MTRRALPSGLAWLAVGCASAAAAAAIFAWSLRYDQALSIANELALDGDASDLLTPARHAAIQARLLWSAIAAVLVAVALAVARERVAGAVARWLDDAAANLRDFRTTVRACCSDGAAPLAVLAAATACGTGLRLLYLDGPMRGDEALVLLAFAERPAYAIASLYTNVGNHVAHTLLMHWSVAAFGDAPWAVRLPVFVAGVSLIPLAYVVGRALGGPVVAATTAALVAGSGGLIEYATNSRGYGLQVLLIVALIGVGSALIERADRFLWSLWALLAALGFWVAPTMALAFGPVALWVALAIALRPGPPSLAGHARALLPFVVATAAGAALTLLLYSPILAVTGLEDLRRNALATAVPPERWAAFAGIMRDIGGLWLRNQSAPIVLTAVAALVAGVLLPPTRLRWMPLAVAAWLLACAAALPTFGYARNWLPIGGPVLLLVACGLARTAQALPWPPAHAQLLSVLLAAGIPLAALATDEAVSRHVGESLADSFPDADAVVGALRRTASADDLVLAHSPGQSTLAYAARRQGWPLAYRWMQVGCGRRVQLFALPVPGGTEAGSARSVYVPLRRDVFSLAIMLEGIGLAAWERYAGEPVARFGATDLYRLQVPADAPFADRLPQRGGGGPAPLAC